MPPDSRATATNTSAEKDRDACRDAAVVYLNGCNVPSDRERAHDLFLEACERGDAASCSQLRENWCTPETSTSTLTARCVLGDAGACRDRARAAYDRCVPFAAVAQADDVFERACRDGDRESCRQLSLMVCRGERDLGELPEGALFDPIWRDSELDYFWNACGDGDAPRCLQLGGSVADRDHARACALARLACEKGVAGGCFELFDQHRRTWTAAYDLERSEHYRSEGMALESQACDEGDPLACLRPVNLFFVPDEEKEAFSKKGDAICQTACEGLDAKRCRELGRGLGLDEAATLGHDFDRWTRRGSRYYPKCRRTMLNQAAARFQTDCDAGDARACTELGITYELDLRDRTDAFAAYRKACNLGSEPACAELDKVRKLESGATVILGARYASPQGPTLSATALIGKVNDTSSGIILPPTVGGRGLLLQFEGSPYAGKVSAGWGAAGGFTASDRGKSRFAVVASPLTVGLALKASVLHAWEQTDELERGAVYVGGEVDVALGLKFSIGVFRGVHGDDGTLFTWGVGIGF